MDGAGQIEASGPTSIKTELAVGYISYAVKMDKKSFMTIRKEAISQFLKF